MALSELQSDILRLLAQNRSEKEGVPIEMSELNRADAILRKATAEPEVMPAPADFNATGWSPDRP